MSPSSTQVSGAIQRRHCNIDGIDDGFICKVFENGQRGLVKTQCKLLSMDLECIDAADRELINANLDKKNFGIAKSVEWVR